MIDGTCELGYEAVREAFGRSLNSGAAVGASVAVLVDGDFKVDLWGGTSDLQTSTPLTTGSRR